jgi:hypothetical protein
MILFKYFPAIYKIFFTFGYQAIGGAACIANPLPAILTMTEYKVIIPDEYYELLDFTTKDLPGVAVINSALREFNAKEVFGWHLSLTLDLVEFVENGMPSKNEQEIIDKYGDLLDDHIKGPDKNKPNGLFLARITWNKTRELVWRVHDPEIADKYLKQVITENSSPRQFDYTIQSDDDWKLTEWHLTQWT